MSTESMEAGRQAPTGTTPALPRPLAWLTNPATMIALALLAISLFATPFYLRTTEQQLFEGELTLTLCVGILSRPIEPRQQSRAPLL